MQRKKVLIVYAHPDDESFGNAGTIAKYTANQQAEFYLAVATRGEAGKLGDPPLTTREQLGYYREQELKSAGKIMGLKDIIFLDYIDATLSVLSAEDQQNLIGKIADTILDVRPDILITFPEDGISKHKDHIAIHYMCNKAIASIADQYIIPKIYYTVFPESAYLARDRVGFGTPDAEITTKIDIADFRKQKGEALLQHKTQVFSIKKVYPALWETNDWSVMPSQEYFQLISLHGKPVDFKNYRETSLLDNL